ncbi:MAG: DUF4870 domain-containing protein [Fidelibacterota bacterium]|nr:MAG: DUF4870 domain-containing protein [Candidatus Neomarinimicrobiota bacterium]
MTEAAPEATAPSTDACKWGMLCHLAALTGLLGNGLGFLIGPLVVWLFKKEDDPFIDDQGKEAVNFQITMFVALIVSALLMLVLIGFVLMIVVGIMMVVFTILGALKANQGELYRYPVSFRFIT